MSRSNQVGSHTTSIFVDDDNMTNVIYHETPVVKFNDDMIILNTGGYYSNTTKTRMNQVSNQFNLKFKVYQKNHSWFCEYMGCKYRWGGHDIVTLNRRSEQLGYAVV